MSAIDETDDWAWYLGGSGGDVKRIHTKGCRYAKFPYHWANKMIAPVLVDHLVASGAIEWHDACKRCAPNLSAAIARARLQRRELLIAAAELG